MARVIKSDGEILIVTISNVASTSDGWIKNGAGEKLYRPVDHYMDDFELDLKWRGIHILNYHRPLSAILEAFFKSGLVLDAFIEPLPSPNSVAYQDEFRAPSFQIMRFRFRH